MKEALKQVSLLVERFQQNIEAYRNPAYNETQLRIEFIDPYYSEDKKLQLAVERALEIIGEAARRVSETYRQAHPEIPWQSIIAQRNALAQEYGEIKHELIWKVATIRIPELISLLEKLIPAPPDTGI